MTIYIDDALIPATVPNGSRLVTSKWSHLMCDTTGPEGTRELISFAVRLGMRPAWIQYRGTAKEHFDLTEGKRWQAIRLGAVQIAYGREGAALLAARRDGVPFDLEALRAQKRLLDEQQDAG
jgi:hypothetical protein